MTVSSRFNSKNDPFSLRERSKGNRYATLFEVGIELGSARFPGTEPSASCGRACSFWLTAM
jgi:hypothetical protein